MDCVPTLVTKENNYSLYASPSEQKIKEVVWSLDGARAPGSDGYSGIFFTTCWEIIASNVVEAVQSFFAGFPLPKGTNIYCKGSVDTPHTGVDTMLQALSQKMKRNGQLVSTLDQGRSTLETDPKETYQQASTSGRH
ncbi:hypothetical protein Taro_022424 [Colocasia esculenta]|uniref:Uncharacterized protein n=1 Tax=Colocasia esculenta TaxID=4460 RepID=A0A843V1T0_COLES|nr:hypothetical protein [Colocasia esculenta]